MDRFFIEPDEPRLPDWRTYYVFDRLLGHGTHGGLAMSRAVASSRDPEIAQFIADALNRRAADKGKAA